MFSRILSAYNRFTANHPASSIIVSTGIIMSAGDILIQVIERDESTSSASKPLNFTRVAHMGVYGLAIFGPFSFYWYTRILPRLAPIKNMNCKKSIIKKILIDQLVGNTFQYSSFLLAMTYFSGRSVTDNPEKISSDFLQCYVSDMCVWPWMMFFNFKYVPIHSQALVVNILNVFWNAYISSIHHKSIKNTTNICTNSTFNEEEFSEWEQILSLSTVL